MTKWIRSEKYSTKKRPVYYHPTYEERGISRWGYLEHFLSNITFNDAKRWFENSKYNTNKIKEA